MFGNEDLGSYFGGNVATEIDENVFNPGGGTIAKTGGDGAFVGEGVRSGIDSWDKAYTNAGGTLPSNFGLSGLKQFVNDNKALLGLAGAGSALLSGSGAQKTGYQGGIPNLVATRNMITAPPVDRRAGAGGVNYGGDVTYSLAPEGQKPYATTRGDSAFITDPQGQANILKGTGGLDTQSMANKISYNLPGGWDKFSGDQKISWFNQNNVTYDQLRTAGVPQSDIDYMWSNGYTSGRPADWGKTNTVTTGTNTVTSGADTITSGSGADTITAGSGADTITAGSGLDALNTNLANSTRGKKIGLTTLPGNWDTFDAKKKIAWYNTHDISPSELLAAGANQSDIDYMYQNGYKIGTATAPVDGSGVQAGAVKTPVGWNNFTETQKIKWYNDNNITVDNLLKAGANQSDIDYMKTKGYNIGANTNGSGIDALASTRPDIGNTQSAGLMSALEQGMGQDKYISNIKDFLNKNNTASDAEIYQQMQQYGIGAEDVASALGVPVSTIQGKISALQQSPRDTGYRGPDPEVESRSSGLQSALDQGMDKGQYIGNIKNFLNKNNTASDAEVFKQMQEYGIGAEDVASALGVPVSTIENKIKALQEPAQSAGMKSAMSQGMNQDQYIGNIKSFLSSNANATDAEVYEQMKQYGISADDVASALGVPVSVIKGKLKALGAEGYAQGGMAEGRYLRGSTDGMADKISTNIDGNQKAALSHGEFVIPADVVSHMGNGNSDAGAKKLYQMMDRIRMARTGNKDQGKKINPDKFMPGGLASAYANGGFVKHFAGGGTTLPAGTTGSESNLSNWAGDYTTNMLGQGQALANMPYQTYMGPLTAGPSALQNKVSQGLEGINFPGTLGQSFTSSAPTGMPTMPADMGTYTPQKKADLYNQFRGQGYGDQAIRQAAGTQTDTDWQGLQDMAAKSGPINIPQQQGIAGSYMNPYLKNVLDPQLEELRRQSQINLQPSLAKLTSAGGYGGGRQAIMESESNRNLLNAQNTAIGQGYSNAYDKGMQQFNTEQGQAKTLADMMAGQGAVNRGIESEGVAADKAQFEEARANPYKMVQYQQSLLQGLPLAAQNYQGIEPSALLKASQGATTVNSLLKNLGLIS